MTVVVTLIAILAMVIIALSLGMWWDSNRADAIPCGYQTDPLPPVNSS